MEPDKPKTYRYQSVLDECLGGDNRPIFLSRVIETSLDVAQVTGAL
jgi:hypothetical protein